MYAGMVAEERIVAIGIVRRTGWTTRPVEKRRSADVIVSIRSSMVRTARRRLRSGGGSDGQGFSYGWTDAAEADSA